MHLRSSGITRDDRNTAKRSKTRESGKGYSHSSLEVPQEIPNTASTLEVVRLDTSHAQDGEDVGISHSPSGICKIFNWHYVIAEQNRFVLRTVAAPPPVSFPSPASNPPSSPLLPVAPVQTLAVGTPKPTLELAYVIVQSRTPKLRLTTDWVPEGRFMDKSLAEIVQSAFSQHWDTLKHRLKMKLCLPYGMNMNMGCIMTRTNEAAFNLYKRVIREQIRKALAKAKVQPVRVEMWIELLSGQDLDEESGDEEDVWF